MTKLYKPVCGFFDKRPFLMVVTSALAAGGAMCVLFYVLQFIILGEGR